MLDRLWARRLLPLLALRVRDLPFMAHFLLVRCTAVVLARHAYTSAIGVEFKKHARHGAFLTRTFASSGVTAFDRHKL